VRANNSRHRAGFRVFDAVDKQLHGEPAHADFVNAHGGQGRRDTICQIDIVEAYYRQIIILVLLSSDSACAPPHRYGPPGIAWEAPGSERTVCFSPDLT
jgi:hypothetical protein